MAVIKDDGAAGIVEIGLGKPDLPSGGCAHGRPLRRRDIDTKMRLARLAVQYPLAAIDTRYRPPGGPGEGRGKKSFRGIEGASGAHIRTLFADAGQ